MLADNLLQALLAMSGLELAAASLALAYVALATRQNTWCWLCALISASCYSVIFWRLALTYQALLNLYYVMMALYGWTQWRQGGQVTVQLSIQRWPLRTHVVAICCLLVVSAALAYVSNRSEAPLLLVCLDALVAVFSVFTTYLVTKKVLENWCYWIIINALACYLYWSQDLYLTALLFVGYVGMSCYGWSSWTRSYHSQTDPDSGEVG